MKDSLRMLYKYIESFGLVFPNIARLQVDCFAALAFAVVVFLLQRSHGDLDLNDTGTGTNRKTMETPRRIWQKMWDRPWAYLCQHQYAGRVGEYFFGKVTMSVGSAQEIGKFSWNGMVFHAKNVFPASLEPI